MKKIKDFFYNVSDIIVIILIIGLAGGIVGWRMQQISSYSTASTEEQGEKIDIDFSDIDLDPEEKIDPIVTPTDPEDPDEEDEPTETDVDENWISSKEIEFTIDSGKSYNEVIEALSQSFGLSTESSLNLYDLLYHKGVELEADSRIGTGTFTIPEGSTIEEIIKIVARL